MYTAIIVAAGKGSRTGLKTNKVLTKIHNKTIIEYSVLAFEKDPLCEAIIIVHKEEDLEFLKTVFKQPIIYTLGGKTREESVHNGLKLVKTPYVLIHDAARPYLDETLLKRVTNALHEHDAVTLALPMSDTVKKISFGKIVGHVDREHLVRIQTPQAFKTALILEAYQHKHKQYTCDATRVIETLNHDVYTVLGSPLNIKFTTIEDMKLLELILHDKDWT